MTLKCVILNKRSQIQKALIVLFPLYDILEKETIGENKAVVVRGWGWGRGSPKRDSE